MFPYNRKESTDSPLRTVIMKRLDELGISQMRAAKMIGMKPNGFNGIVKGRFHPSERSLFCIASTFNIKVEDLKRAVIADDDSCFTSSENT